MNADLEHRVIEFLSLFGGPQPDLARLAAAFSPDARLLNPVGHSAPVTGRDAIVKLLASQSARYQSAVFKVDSMASNATQVFTARTDTVTLKDGRVVHALIAGVFDLNKAGEITFWREYWDPADVQAQLKAG